MPSPPIWRPVDLRGVRARIGTSTTRSPRHAARMTGGHARPRSRLNLSKKTGRRKVAGFLRIPDEVAVEMVQDLPGERPGRPQGANCRYVKRRLPLILDRVEL